MPSIPLIEIIRSSYVESMHRGSAVVVREGKLIFSIGDPNSTVSLRSTAKPFILLPLLRNNGINAFNIDDEELAIMASSHNGEQKHRITIQKLLKKVGLQISDINCGIHPPYFEWLLKDYVDETNYYLKQLFHNCSGKHASMLLMCKLLSLPIKNYWEFSHPLQKIILNNFREFLEVDKNSSTFGIGIDGCGVPTYFLPLIKLATAYQKLSNDLELKPLVNSILNSPFMIAGTDRIDSLISEKCRYLAKSGSEGLFCIAIPQQNIGISLKIESGCDDAAESAIIRLMEKMGLLTESQMVFFLKYMNQPLYTSTKVFSGQYRPCF